MKKYKNYIIGLVVLIIGFGAGWLLKPSTPSAAMDHSDHDTEMATGSTENEMGEEIWTCSMHPQIRQNEPGLCPICEMDLIPLDNSMGSDDPTVLQMSNAAAKLAQIETTVVGSGNSDNEAAGVKVEGTIELDERSIKSQSAHVGGRIEDMRITFEGEYVKAGQQIATVYSTEILAASEELLTAAKFDDKVAGLKDASIQKLKNWKITDAQINQILSSGQPIETIDLFADHSGYVLSKKISQGDYVRPGQAMYTLGNTGRLWLILNVFESDLSNVKRGQTVSFSTPSLGAQSMSAMITYIDPILNSQTRTAKVRAEINNVGNRLKPGMLIEGTVNISRSKSISNTEITVPKTAVLWTGDRSVVYVKLQDNEVPSFQFREVTIGARRGNHIVIEEGLELGDEVVTHGAFTIDAAAQLNNMQSMMNRDVTIKSEAGPEQLPNYVESTPDAFKRQINTLAQNYISLKDAFVDTDAQAASLEVVNVLAALNNVDMSLVKDDAHIFWMDQSNAIQTHGEKIKEASDIENQRKQFYFLSEAMITALKVFGHSGDELFVLYCPMANNNQGADWVSQETGIRNPYFGDRMMKCGSVKDTLIFN